MTDESQPRRRDNILVEPLPDGSAVLFDPRNQMAYPVTASAALIWEACDGHHTAEALVGMLEAAYDAPPDVIARDVDQLLRHLSEIGLLETTAGAGTGA